MPTSTPPFRYFDAASPPPDDAQIVYDAARGAWVSRATGQVVAPPSPPSSWLNNYDDVLARAGGGRLATAPATGGADWLETFGGPGLPPPPRTDDPFGGNYIDAPRTDQPPSSRRWDVNAPKPVMNNRLTFSDPRAEAYERAAARDADNRESNSHVFENPLAIRGQGPTGAQIKTKINMERKSAPRTDKLRAAMGDKLNFEDDLAERNSQEFSPVDVRDGAEYQDPYSVKPLDADEFKRMGGGNPLAERWNRASAGIARAAGAFSDEAGKKYIESADAERDEGFAGRVEAGMKVAEGRNLDISKATFLANGVPTMQEFKNLGLTQVEMENLFSYLTHIGGDSMRKVGQGHQDYGAGLRQSADEVAPLWHRADEYQRKLAKIEAKVPGVSKTWGLGDITGMTDILVADALMSGDKKYTDMALGLQRRANTAQAEDAYNHTGWADNLITGAVQMAPLMGRGMLLNAVPVVGSVLSTSMWGRQGMGSMAGRIAAEGGDPSKALPLLAVSGVAYAMIERIQAAQTLSNGVKDIAEAIERPVMQVFKEKTKDYLGQNGEEVVQDILMNGVVKNALAAQGIKYDPGTIGKQIKETLGGTMGPMLLYTLPGLAAGVAKTAGGNGNTTATRSARVENTAASDEIEQTAAYKEYAHIRSNREAGPQRVKFTKKGDAIIADGEAKGFDKIYGERKANELQQGAPPANRSVTAPTNQNDVSGKNGLGDAANQLPQNGGIDNSDDELTGYHEQYAKRDDVQNLKDARARATEAEVRQKTIDRWRQGGRTEEDIQRLIADEKENAREARFETVPWLEGYEIFTDKEVATAVERLQGENIPFAVEATDLGNFSGLNALPGGHDGADEHAKAVIADTYLKEIAEFGGIAVKRKGADEFAVIWPGFTADEVEPIRDAIEKKIRRVRDERGLGEVPYIKGVEYEVDGVNYKLPAGLKTGSLHSFYGIVDGDKTTPYRAMYKEADKLSEDQKGVFFHSNWGSEATVAEKRKKDEKRLADDTKTGYNYNREGTENAGRKILHERDGRVGYGGSEEAIPSGITRERRDAGGTGSPRSAQQEARSGLREDVRETSAEQPSARVAPTDKPGAPLSPEERKAILQLPKHLQDILRAQGVSIDAETENRQNDPENQIAQNEPVDNSPKNEDSETDSEDTDDVYDKDDLRFAMRQSKAPEFESAETAGVPAGHLEKYPNARKRARELWEEKGADSPFFKKWFGDSKVVDEDGKPLVVYHGGTFKKSDIPREGMHFGTEKSAARRIKDKRSKKETEINAVYLSIKNPKWLPDGGWKDWTSFVKTAKQQGYDGIVYKNKVEDKGSLSYIAFSPNQVKSATDNAGTFDGENPDIRFAQRENEKDENFSDDPAPISKRQFERMLKKLARTGLAKDVITDAGAMREKLARKFGKDNADRFMSVWHGSPHAFDAFSTAFMGTGEGAQAYGWGLYFTDERGIAEGYAKQRSNPFYSRRRVQDYRDIQVFVGGKIYYATNYGDASHPAEKVADALVASDGSVYKAKKGFEKRYEDMAIEVRDSELVLEEAIEEGDEKSEIERVRAELQQNKKYLDEIKNILDVFNAPDFKLVGIAQDDANLYKTKIHGDKTVDELNFMRWDKPLTKTQRGLLEKEAQKEDYKKVGRPLLYTDARDGRGDNFIGQRYYERLQNLLGSPKAASEFLLRAGIDGIQYPTGYKSKGSHEDSYNYVVFDDKALEIVEHIRLMSTPAGEVYGFATTDGVIYLDPDKMNANTPIHEYGHLWIDFVREHNKPLYNRLTATAAQSKFYKDLKAAPAYAHLSDKQRAEEAAAYAIGNIGEMKFTNETALEKFRGFLRDLWNWVAERLGLDVGDAEGGASRLSADDIGNMTFGELTGGAARELLGGRRIGEADGEAESEAEDEDNRFAKRGVTRDAEYMEAVKNGDMEKAQRMVDNAAREKGYISSSEYKMQHQAPNRDDDNLATIKESGLVPDDFWTHPHYYTYDYDRSSYWTIRSALEKPLHEKMKSLGDRRIWVYRSVPKSVKESEIRNGDWVTPDRDYAAREGEGIRGGYKIIRQRVPLKHLWWDGNSIAELGYDDGKEYAYANTKNNRKLVDPVTYDHDGNIIPLSKRFNKMSDDVRFAVRLSPEDRARRDADPRWRITEALRGILQKQGIIKFNEALSDWGRIPDGSKGDTDKRKNWEKKWTTAEGEFTKFARNNPELFVDAGFPEAMDTENGAMDRFDPHDVIYKMQEWRNDFERGNYKSEADADVGTENDPLVVGARKAAFDSLTKGIAPHEEEAQHWDGYYNVPELEKVSIERLAPREDGRIAFTNNGEEFTAKRGKDGVWTIEDAHGGREEFEAGAEVWVDKGFKKWTVREATAGRRAEDVKKAAAAGKKAETKKATADARKADADKAAAEKLAEANGLAYEAAKLNSAAAIAAAEKAKFEAEKLKLEADKLKLEADKAKFEHDTAKEKTRAARAEADKAKAEAQKARAEWYAKVESVKKAKKAKAKARKAKRTRGGTAKAVIKELANQAFRINAIRGNRASTMDAEANKNIANILDNLVDFRDSLGKAMVFFQDLAVDYIKNNPESTQGLFDDLRTWREERGAMPQAVRDEVEARIGEAVADFETAQLQELLDLINEIKKEGRERMVEQLFAEQLERQMNITDMLRNMKNTDLSELARPHSNRMKDKEDAEKKLGAPTKKKVTDALWENLRAERIFAYFDNIIGKKDWYNNLKLMTNAIFHPIMESEDRRQMAIEAAVRRYQKIHKDIDPIAARKDVLITVDMKKSDRYDVMELVDERFDKDFDDLGTEPKDITYENAMFVYAHSQNEDGRNHLVGSGYTAEGIEKIIKAMPEKYKDAVDAMIDYFDSEQFERMNEVFVREHQTEMMPVSRYFPIRHLDIMPTPGAVGEESEVKRAAVKKGMTKSRIESYRPFNSEKYFDVVVESIIEAEKYIAFNDAIRNANRYLLSERLSGAMKLKNEKAYKELLKWVEDAARARPTALDAIDKFWSKFARNVALARLGGNILTWLKQLISIIHALPYVKPTHAANAAAVFARHPLETIAAAKEKSVMMRNRADSIETIFSDMKERGQVNKIIKMRLDFKRLGIRENTEQVLDRYREFMMAGIKHVDMATAAIVWTAKYSEVMEKTQNETMAVRAADALVRKTQSMGGDLNTSSSFRSKSALTRTFTMFLNDANQNLNLLFEVFAGWKNRTTAENMGLLFAHGVAPALVMGWVSSGFTKHPWDEPEDYLEWFIETWTGGMPFFGEFPGVLARWWLTNPMREARGENKQGMLGGLGTSPAQEALMAATRGKVMEMLLIWYGVPGYVPYRRIKGALDSGDARRLIWSERALKE